MTDFTKKPNSDVFKTQHTQPLMTVGDAQLRLEVWAHDKTSVWMLVCNSSTDKINIPVTDKDAAFLMRQACL